MNFYIYLLAILTLLLPITNSNFTSEDSQCSTNPQNNQSCKCHLKGERIFCCHINATEELCLPHGFSAPHSGSVTSLAIQSLKLSHLALTYGFISRLGIDPKTLKRLQITQGASLENVNICSIHHQHFQHSNSTLKCQDLVGLKILDLRHNNLKTLEEFQLPSLQELYLSGSTKEILNYVHWCAFMPFTILGNPWSCLPKKNETQHPRMHQATKSPDDLSIGDQPVIIHKSLQWLLNLPNNTRIMEEEETTCALESDTWVGNKSNYSNAQLLDFLRENKVSYLWFLQRNSISAFQMHFFLSSFWKTIQETCPLECQCSVDQYKLRLNANHLVKVECQNRNLSQLPDRLPPKTRRLDVSLNQVRLLKERNDLICSHETFFFF